MEVSCANTGVYSLLAWAKLSYVLLLCVFLTFLGCAPEMLTALVLASRLIRSLDKVDSMFKIL